MYKAPSIKDRELSGIIEEIYRAMNEVVTRIPQTTTTTSTSIEKEGTIRLEKTSGSDYKIVAQTDAGKAEVGITLKNKGE